MKLLISLCSVLLFCAACHQQPEAKKNEAYIREPSIIMLVPDAAKLQAYSGRIGTDSMQTEALQGENFRQAIAQLANKEGIKVIKDSTNVAINFIKASNDTVQIQRDYIDNPWPVIFFSPDKNPLIIGKKDPEKAFRLYF